MKANQRKKSGRIKMRYIRRIISLNQGWDLSYRQIARVLGVPRFTVSDYIRRFQNSDLTVEDLNDKTDGELYETLFADEPRRPGGRRIGKGCFFGPT